MFCPSCGKDIPDGSAFCLHCGKSLGSAERPTPSSRRWTARLTLLFVLTFLVGYYLYQAGSRSSDSASSNLARKLVAPFLQPVSEKLTSGAQVVKAGRYLYIDFNVDPARMVDARVVGTFHATGGFGNDIQVVLAEEGEFENWVNGHKARVLHATEKITSGKIDVPITEAGRYRLAFNNGFSLVSDKTVIADIELHYKERR